MLTIKKILSKLLHKKDDLEDISKVYANIPEDKRGNYFVLTGNTVSAWSMDNSRIKDFSFEKLYDNCTL